MFLNRFRTFLNVLSVFNIYVFFAVFDNEETSFLGDIQWGVLIHNIQQIPKTPDQLDQCIKTCHWSLILDLHTFNDFRGGEASSELVVLCRSRIKDQW